MVNLDEQLKIVRKLQFRAASAKLELHDLAEDLPVRWTDIKRVAEKTFDAFAELDAARKKLSMSEKSR
ncbi:CCE_0567 family metalloprotein (plasmid) [Rhizobium sp. CC1099]|uniref:CCE_0567 family metalloprotein n=1 Tax=Rhizobium sp. CC1099 TaxID=3039160 RepID=UPI0024B22386|nr:CCE_0567 family metalloprotein [Rhizobium sp. CC1099]WFU92052.1 CCE_0567 family metalloprotein [Rhizobium sp. CC1099]